jgi:thiamine-phosphate diphosphorylase
LIPRLHLVTDDVVLQSADFIRTATELLRTIERNVALHVRARTLSAAQLFELVSALLPAAQRARACLIVNDRVDIARTARAHGVQLGARTLPIRVVRELLEPKSLIGYSAHAADQAAQAAADGADFIFAGSIYQTASHPDTQPGGTELLKACVARVQLPVLAIGGVTPERVPEILQAGAHGVAVIRAVWQAADPVQAGRQFARLLEQ